jgi:RHH-type proline utilization regulon transcriptional repressor/proline dehydrogenase/delta 1-pyrroline-5-carboxylate dehydrogenase
MTGMPSTENSFDTPVLSTIEKRHWQEWTVYFPDEYKNVLLDGDQLNSSAIDIFEHLSKHVFNSFRQQVDVGNTPFLLGIFFEEKEFRFYSPKLGRELFLLEHIAPDSMNVEEYDSFKAHADKVATLTTDQFPSSYELTTSWYDLTDMGSGEITGLKEAELDLVDRLLIHVREHHQGLFEKMSDYALGLTAEYKLLRIHMLKFLAILPNLDHDVKGIEVKRILIESMRRLLQDSSIARIARKKGQEKPLPFFMVLGFTLVKSLAGVLPPGVLASLVRNSVKIMARRFIAGENIDEVQQSFDGLFKTNRDVTLDQLGELVVSEKEADLYQDEVLKLINGLGQYIPKGDKNAAGINRAHVSIKVSALCRDMKSEAFDYTYEMVAPRLKKILLAAKDKDVFINIDAEHYHYRDVVLKIYRKVLLETEELKDYQQTGIVVQAYLRDGAEHLMEIIELAKERGLTMPLRLVKGAYWDAETVEADAHSFNAPEFLNKEETDLHFRQIILEILKNYPHVQLCVASHNYADHCFAEVAREKLYNGHPIVEHQCLHMTYEALSTAMAKMGWPVRNYVPIGGLLVGMAYLVRRIMENSSQVGVLTIMRSHKNNVKLESAYDLHFNKKLNDLLLRDQSQAGLTSEFFNISPVRMYLESHHKVVEKSFEDFKADLGKTYMNNFVLEGEEISIVSSSNPELLVGKITFATASDTKKAIDLSQAAFDNGAWSNAPWIVRSSVLLKAADIMLARRNELSALVCYEAGKAIDQAYGDIDEAIDFLTYYARQERKFGIHENITGKGPVAAITPWNFPLAIPTGMVAAPLVAGNTVILKSAEQTPLIAQELVDIFHQAGVPQDVLIHLPGMGESVGDTLVNSENIAAIVFTGSRAVGTMIAKKASTRFYRDQFPVRVITEMGGKNAVVVTANAELDETVAGILNSAFGHAGQKCSAASRILVHHSVKDRLVERLSEACRDIEVGEAYNPSTIINPVITLEDRDRLRRQAGEAVEEARKYGGRVYVDRSAEELPGYCVGPVLIELPASRSLHIDSFARRELFGPVLHIIAYDTLEQAMELYNGTEYGLTGGIFCQSQDDIDYCCSRMKNGNIYVNRNITGARVGIEPFGGFKHSGTGPKAGSKFYLHAFHQIKDHGESDHTYTNIEEGSDRVEYALACNMILDRRMEAFQNCVSGIVDNFESLYGGILGEEKKILINFKKWSYKQLKDFILKEHKNHIIPGQISYNDYTMTVDKICTIASSEIPPLAILMQVLSALGMGCGMTILARSQKSYEWWSRFENILNRNGWPSSSFKVFFVSDQEMKGSLKNVELSHIIVDGPREMVSQVIELMNADQGERELMVSVRSLYDAPRLEDFKTYCLQYILVRSFAINTMRHGAPLELDL